MTIDKQLIKRISAVALMLLGIAFGGNWSSTGTSFGDSVFSALGLPVWSNETNGTHYPAIVGMFVILAGATVLNMTLSKKARIWVWSIVVLVLVVMGIGFAYV